MRRRNNRNRNRNNSQRRDDNYLMTPFEMLLKECRRLQNRVSELERGNNARAEESNELENYEEFWNDFGSAAEEKKETPPVEIKAVSRRSTSDLYKEAKSRYEKQQAEQEKFVDEAMSRQEKKPVEEVLSENRKKFYVEKARLIVGDR